MYAILQDHLGYLWLGTQNGLVRYDGYNMKVYTRDPDDSLSISDRTITTIYEDKDGTLWIGTPFGGLNRFDRNTETFTSYLHNTNDSTSLVNNTVLCIIEVNKGNILVGTSEGLSLFHRNTNDFKTINKITASDTIIPSTNAIADIIADSLTGNIYVSYENKILMYDREKELLKENNPIPEYENELGVVQSFYQSKDGAIWIGHSGLARFNSLNNTIKFYPSFSTKLNNYTNLITEDDNGYIWCNTDYYTLEDQTISKGLICFDPRREIFKRYEYDPENELSLSGNFVYSLYRDRSGIIWAGTWHDGLNKWDSKKQKFKRYTYNPENPKGRHFNRVNAVSEDADGIIWFGTDNGFYSYDRLSNKFHNYLYRSNKQNNRVVCIYIENSDIIWFGTESNGLAKFDRHTGSIQFYTTSVNDSTTINDNLVYSILTDNNDILWIGTNIGLNKFDKGTGKFTRYNFKKNIYGDSRVQTIFKDRAGILWLGTNLEGLTKFDPVNGTFKSFHFTKGIGLTTVPLIYENKKDKFWIGTYHTGVHLFDREKETSVYNITEKEGLANNHVELILEDDLGNLWIGTDNGLSKFNPQSRSIKNFHFPGGIDQNRFYGNGNALKSSTGEMLFSTYDGFIMFHPDSIKDDPVPPQVVISNVSLFNETDEKLEYDGFISELKELKLSYNENDLRFDYVGLHYGDPSKNQYKYMLENFDEDWINAGTQRNATYTNLDAGEYVFRVKACNADGVWNEEGASLKIIIPSPFWATWWAYSFYVLFILGILYSIRKYELGRTHLKNQHKIDEVKLKEREETDKMKSRFFANISHEFRTPLTLIKGPAEKINGASSGEEIEKQTNIIKRNADRLLALINQLLDLSKLEAGKLELKASKSNIVCFIKGITMSFESIAERRDITLKVKSSNNEIELYFDKEKMTKIMSNLLSNAFKFTPEGGQVTVTIEPPSFPPLVKEELKVELIEIKVRDTGIGISEEELPKLFDRFYQVDSSFTREYEGTGIGLALTKELAELHHGTISVTSEVGNPEKVGTGWTEFIVTLPVGRKHLKDEEIVETEEQITDNLLVDKEAFVLEEAKETTDQQRLDEAKNIILVVEDNAEVREYIKDSLGNDFQFEEASNGDQGVRKAEQIIPDLIISDIMMPKMDGNELARILKNDEKTSHIPIILLTAKSEQESKLEGLETGADAYLNKPFDTKELQIRINNLINIRRKLQQKYSRVDFIPVKKTEEKKLSNLEEQFMCKVMEVIVNHLSEEEFSIEQFGKEVGMSRVQLHRKLKALSGKSASHYLRSVRLSKAKQMIEEQKGNISEIAYSVGFSSPQYFTRSFKEEFGFPPSDLQV